MTTQAKRTPGPWRVRFHPTKPDECFIEGPRPANMAYAVEIMGDDYNGFGGLEQRKADALFIVRLENAEAKVREALERERPSSEMGEWLNLGPQPGCTPSLIPIATAHRIWRAYELKRAALALLDGEGNGSLR